MRNSLPLFRRRPLCRTDILLWTAGAFSVLLGLLAFMAIIDHNALGLFFCGISLAAVFLGLALAAHRYAAAAKAVSARLAAANESLQEEIQERRSIDGTLINQQQELEGSTQNLAQTNALLAEASGRFQEMFQGLPVACVCYDRHGRIMEWNRAFEQMHALENALGQPVWEALYRREEAPQIADAVTAAFAGEVQDGIEWMRSRPDGSTAYLYSSILPLRGVGGEITGAISADVDISAQHEAEEALRESEERLHALYNTTSQQDISFEMKMDALLTMGSAQFGLEVGVLARINSDQYEVLQAVSPEDAIAPGLIFPICNTYCREALALADVVSFEQAGLTERRETPAYRQSGMEAYIGTPIRVDGEIWGMLCFAGAQPHPRLFTSGDREMLRLMAQWIGGEVSRHQAEEAVRESEERFRTAIAAMSEGLILMDANGVIRLWNEGAERILEKTQTEMRGWRPLNPDFMPVCEDGSTFPEGSYPLMVSLRRGIPQHDVVMGLPRSGGGMVWVSVNAKPLFPPSSDTPHAIVATFSDITERRRHEDLIAAQVIQIKEHAALLEAQKAELEAANGELETLALRDGLTGLSNRRAFGQRVALEMGRATRYGLPLSLLLLDVDRFKEYNDTFGHVAGDEVLKTLSQVLHMQGRETDFVARYGGEEFVAVLPHTDSQGAIVVAERLREAISAVPWPARLVTASIGAATLLPSMKTEDDLVSAADRALYAAKNKGRDNVVHALSLDALSLDALVPFPVTARPSV